LPTPVYDLRHFSSTGGDVERDEAVAGTERVDEAEVLGDRGAAARAAGLAFGLPLGRAGLAVDRQHVAAPSRDRSRRRRRRALLWLSSATPPLTWFSQAPPSALMFARLSCFSGRVVLVAEVAADLRKVLVARGAATVEIGRGREDRRRCGDGARRQQDGGEKLQFMDVLRLINMRRRGDAQVRRPRAIRLSQCHSMEARRPHGASKRLVPFHPSSGFGCDRKTRLRKPFYSTERRFEIVDIDPALSTGLSREGVVACAWNGWLDAGARSG
jgi:hypothetical protein